MVVLKLKIPVVTVFFRWVFRIVVLMAAAVECGKKALDYNGNTDYNKYKI